MGSGSRSGRLRGSRPTQLASPWKTCRPYRPQHPPSHTETFSGGGERERSPSQTAVRASSAAAGAWRGRGGHAAAGGKGGKRTDGQSSAGKEVRDREWGWGAGGVSAAAQDSETSQWRNPGHVLLPCHHQHCGRQKTCAPPARPPPHMPIQTPRMKQGLAAQALGVARGLSASGWAREIVSPHWSGGGPGHPSEGTLSWRESPNRQGSPVTPTGLGWSEDEAARGLLLWGWAGLGRVPPGALRGTPYTPILVLPLPAVMGPPPTCRFLPRGLHLR